MRTFLPHQRFSPTSLQSQKSRGNSVRSPTRESVRMSSAAASWGEENCKGAGDDHRPPCAFFLRVCFLCRVWYYGTANLVFYNFIYLFIFYFQILIFQQEEAAKEMKEKQKKELEKLKHLDLSE